MIKEKMIKLLFEKYQLDYSFTRIRIYDSIDTLIREQKKYSKYKCFGYLRGFSIFNIDAYSVIYCYDGVGSIIINKDGMMFCTHKNVNIRQFEKLLDATIKVNMLMLLNT